MSKNIGKNIGIIGAGIGGLVTAIHLANFGHQVSIYEQNSQPGGKAGQFFLSLPNKDEFDQSKTKIYTNKSFHKNSEHNSQILHKLEKHYFDQQKAKFRFDSGPSILTLIEIFQELFQSVGQNLEDYLELKKIEKICNYFFEDSNSQSDTQIDRITVYQDQEKFIQEIETKTSDTAATLQNFTDYTQKLWEFSYPLISKPDFIQKGLLSKDFWKAAKNWQTFSPGQSFTQKISEYWQDPKMRTIFNHFATYTGSNPYESPAFLNSISYVEQVLGVYVPSNGIYGLVQALEKLALKLGVKILYNAKVQKIAVQNNLVTGVILQKNLPLIHHDFLVCNLDKFSAQKFLLKRQIKPNKTKLSNSAIVFYWGVKGEFPELDLHNIFFSKNPKEEYFNLFKSQKLPQDPTVYVNIGSKLCSADSPPGYENWFVMVNLPGQTLTSEQIRKLKDKILSKIQRILGKKIQIVVEKINQPQDFSQQTGSWNGSLYGFNSHNLKNFFARKNQDSKYKNLFWVGGTAHPGGGMPMVALSGSLVSQQIQRQIK